MRQLVIALVLGIALVMIFSGGLGAAAAQLQQRAVSTTGLVDDHVIVGRARCGPSTWLLTDAPALIQMKREAKPELKPERKPDDRSVNWSILTTAVHGLAKDERPWGLACVGDGSLWTLAGYRTLARVSFGGEVLSRTKLRQPLLGVFGVGQSLLLQQPPTAVGVPLLTVASVPDINHAKPWPGLSAPRQMSAKRDFTSGLVACGLPNETHLPCWLTNQPRITISAGTAPQTFVVAPRFIAAAGIDRNIDTSVPLWDVALSSSASIWILTSAPPSPEGRRVGLRLTRSNARGDELGAVDLKPRARLIVSAGERTAVLLTSAGSLVEVAAP